VPRPHHLLWLAFTAMRHTHNTHSSREQIASIESRKELLFRSRRDFQHAGALTVLNLPSNLGAELEVVALVVDRPGAVGLHVDAAVSVGNQLAQA